MAANIDIGHTLVKLQIAWRKTERTNILNSLGLLDFGPRVLKERDWLGWISVDLNLLLIKENWKEMESIYQKWREGQPVECKKTSQNLGWSNWIGAFQRRTLNDIWMFELFWNPIDRKHCMQCKVCIFTHAGGWAFYFVETRVEIQAMF